MIKQNTLHTKEGFINEYIQAYENFEKNLIDAICHELELSVDIAEMGKDHLLAFIELLEVFGKFDVFEQQNEILRSQFESEWLPYIVEMTKTILPDEEISSTPDFGDLEGKLRDHFGLYDH